MKIKNEISLAAVLQPYASMQLFISLAFPLCGRTSLTPFFSLKIMFQDSIPIQKKKKNSLLLSFCFFFLRRSAYFPQQKLTSQLACKTELAGQKFSSKWTSFLLLAPTGNDSHFFTFLFLSVVFKLRDWQRLINTHKSLSEDEVSAATHNERGLSDSPQRCAFILPEWSIH